jgi:hypothetical protein
LTPLFLCIQHIRINPVCANQNFSGGHYGPNQCYRSAREAYPPGAVIILPGNTPHFHWAKSGEYVTQITAMGPLGLEYLSAKDDPRNNNS